MQKSALAGARFPDHRKSLAAAKLEIKPLEYNEFALSGTIGLRQALCPDQDIVARQNPSCGASGESAP